MSTKTARMDDFDHAFRLIQSALDQLEPAETEGAEPSSAVQERTAPLLELLGKMHLADIADVIEDLSPNDQTRFIHAAAPIIDAELLFNLKESFRQKILDQLGFQHFKKSIPELSNEDIFTLIEEFEAPMQEQFLNLLPIRRRKIIRLYLTYPEEAVGRYMSVDFITLSPKDTVAKALEVIREKTDLPANFSEFFLVNSAKHLVGIVFLKDILQAESDLPLKQLALEELITIYDNQSKAEASALFSKYKSLRVPVLSASGAHADEVVGILRSDDILEIAFEEVSEGILNVGGVSSDPPSTFWRGCFMRLRWIALTVINALFSPLIIDRFQSVVAHVAPLAALMPLVASIGGVVGIQTVSVILKEYAEGGLRPHNPRKARRSILRESAMGLLNGLVIGFLLGGLTTLWYSDRQLGCVLSMAMLFSMTWAALIGASLPILSIKFGFDANLSSGPIITTLTDVSGYVIFLSMAKAWLM